jgi:hypothetical protein
MELLQHLVFDKLVQDTLFAVVECACVLEFFYHGKRLELKLLCGADFVRQDLKVG